MKQTTIPIKPDARVMVKCGGDLSVEGIDTATLIVIVDHGEGLRMKEENGTFRITADSDCRVLLPRSVTVTIEKVGGDATISNLIGRVVVGKVGDNLKLEKIGGGSIESVGSDCLITDTEGEIEIARIGDSLTAENIQGLQAGSVGSDARFKNINAKLDVTAGDEISIQVAKPDLPEIRAKAGSDIHLFVVPEAQGQLNLSSGGEDIIVHAGGQDAELAQGSFSILLGEGGSMVSFTAGDAIRVTDRESPQWDEERPVWSDDHWKDFGIQIEQRVKEGLKLAEDAMEHAARQARMAGRHAGKQVDRAMRDLEERGFNALKGRKVVGFSTEEEKPAGKSSKTGPSDEERMLVLRMLQEKKITVEEAEKLLTALDR
jgi:hypothetical protein